MPGTATRPGVWMVQNSSPSRSHHTSQVAPRMAPTQNSLVGLTERGSLSTCTEPLLSTPGEQGVAAKPGGGEHPEEGEVRLAEVQPEHHQAAVGVGGHLGGEGGDGGHQEAGQEQGEQGGQGQD